MHPNYTSINVEQQDGSPNSLLTWYRKLIWLRKKSEDLSLGKYQPITLVPKSVYAFLRQTKEESVLVLPNFSNKNVSFSHHQPNEFAKQCRKIIFYALFVTSYSIVNVPYSALTPDLTKDFDERTCLNGFRMASAIVGTLIAAGATSILVGLFINEATGFSSIAALNGLIFILMSLIVFWGTKGKDRIAPETHAENMVSLHKSALKNKPFILVAITYILHTFAITTISSSLIYYLKYYFGQEDLISLTFLVLLLTSVAFIPFWV